MYTVVVNYALDNSRCRYSITKGVQIKPIKCDISLFLSRFTFLLLLLLLYDIIINPLRKGKYSSPGRALVRDDNKTDIFFSLSNPRRRQRPDAPFPVCKRGDIKKTKRLYDVRPYIYTYRTYHIL